VGSSGSLNAAICSIVLVAAAFSAAALAADTSPDTASEVPRLEEIVVTAQKREENVQKIPITVDVVSEAQLKAEGITSAPELIKTVPGLVFQYLNGQADPYIRGMGSEQTNLTQESSVGVYVDGVYQAGTTSAMSQFADVDRIEVLKGPQGTLFGRNTTGGAINIITKDPVRGLGGTVDFSSGTWDTEHFNGYITGGNDTVAASLAAVYAYHGGYTHNLYDNTWLDNLNTAALRGKIRLMLSNDWTATVAASYSENHDTSNLAYLYFNNNAQPLDLGGHISTDPRATYNDQGDKERRVVQDDTASLTIKGSMGDVTVMSITAYSHEKDASAEDQDASDINEEVLFANQTLWSVSQELQFLSPTNNPFRWIGGLYYFASEGGFPKPLDLTITVGDNPLATTFLGGEQKTESEAVYGQATYDFTDIFSVTAGGRFNRDKKTLLPGRITEIPGEGVFLGPEAGQSDTWNNSARKGCCRRKSCQIPCSTHRCRKASKRARSR
jgi:iron complex outermembrane receptor protein